MANCGVSVKAIKDHQSDLDPCQMIVRMSFIPNFTRWFKRMSIALLFTNCRGGESHVQKTDKKAFGSNQRDTKENLLVEDLKSKGNEIDETQKSQEANFNEP